MPDAVSMLTSVVPRAAAAQRARLPRLRGSLAGALGCALLFAAGPLTAAALPAAPTAAPATASPAAPQPANAAGALPAGSAAGAGAPAEPAPSDGAVSTRGLDEEVQGLKKDVVDVNKDLFILEEELLFPANTQVAVFLAVDVGDFFALDSVQLKIDRKEVIDYLYTPREVEALLKGGVQRLYLGNLKVGRHELVAFFNGKGPNDRPYKRGASIRFEKGIGAKYLELKIDDRQRKLEPEFEIRDWD
ncbi:MAG: AraC family transcriptional regulator [Steroidobacteraceae bacterium]